jgi:hypothetical protein
MTTLDLSAYPVDAINWKPDQSIKQRRNAGGRFRGTGTGPMFYNPSVDIAALPYQKAREFEAHIEGFEGATTPFDLILPLVCTPSGQAKNVLETAVTVTGNNGKTLSTTGWPINTQNLFKAGDLIRLTSLSKTYKIAVPVNSNGSGQADIILTRPLLAPAIMGENIIFNPVRLSVTQTSPAQEYEIPGNKHSAFELDFQEIVL